MRRTLLLAALALAALMAVRCFSPPERPSEEARAARGHRVLNVPPRRVRGFVVAVGPERVAARRVGTVWEIDGRLAEGVANQAVEDFVAALSRLRALDVFRSADELAFGFDAPRAVITVETPRRTMRVVIGAHTATGVGFYARRDGDPRVLKIGTGFEAAIEQVFQARRVLTRPGTTLPPADATGPRSGTSALLRNARIDRGRVAPRQAGWCHGRRPIG